MLLERGQQGMKDYKDYKDYKEYQRVQGWLISSLSSWYSFLFVS